MIHETLDNSIVFSLHFSLQIDRIFTLKKTWHLHPFCLWHGIHQNILIRNNDYFFTLTNNWLGLKLWWILNDFTHRIIPKKEDLIIFSSLNSSSSLQCGRCCYFQTKTCSLCLSRSCVSVLTPISSINAKHDLIRSFRKWCLVVGCWYLKLVFVKDRQIKSNERCHRWIWQLVESKDTVFTEHRTVGTSGKMGWVGGFN